MEDLSREVFASRLPPEWVVRAYKPDYGIDVAVELFDSVDDEHTKADTLGEMFFGQLKSTERIETLTVAVHPRYNVEKKPLTENKALSKQISVIPLKIEVGELLTVQAMSPALPVILFLIELETERVFFVCLNDLIDKVILPADPQFKLKETKTIWIPIENELTDFESALIALRFYAKRPKLYAAFTKFSYQEQELQYLLNRFDLLSIEELLDTDEFHTVRHFLDGILQYDFWETTPMWTPIAYSHQMALDLQGKIALALMERGFSVEMFPQALKLPERVQQDRDFIVRTFFFGQLRSLWATLKNLANMHEEICREWLLPTFMAHDLSYYKPNSEEV
jgi:hypothetical protein